MNRHFQIALTLLACLCVNTSCAKQEDEAITRTDKIKLTTPTAGWDIQPISVHQAGEEIWSLYEIEEPRGIAAQVISEVSSAVEFKASSLEAPVKQHVIGKTWNWDSNPEITFIDSLEAYQKLIKQKSGTRIDTLPRN